MLTPAQTLKFRHKVDAFKKAQNLSPESAREKVSGFVLLVGSGPDVIFTGEDRDAAVNRAVQILEEKDTTVFLSKLQAKIGENLVVKNQLILQRKFE